jgi:hypothetical protein
MTSIPDKILRREVSSHRLCWAAPSPAGRPFAFSYQRIPTHSNASDLTAQETAHKSIVA